MVPMTSAYADTKIVNTMQPGKTYRLDRINHTVGGFSDGREAVEQSVYKILNTQRYQYVIYSWDYGIELADLFGEPVSYVCPELERRIREALLQDDRIRDVDGFTFDTTVRHRVETAFTVHSIYGDITALQSFQVMTEPL